MTSKEYVNKYDIEIASHVNRHILVCLTQLPTFFRLFCWSSADIDVNLSKKSAQTMIMSYTVCRHHGTNFI